MWLAFVGGGFCIWRRKKRNLSPGDPDRLHLHSLVNVRVSCPLLLGASNTLRNSATGAFMWFALMLPVTLATHYWAHTFSLIAAFLTFVFAYSAVHARITQFRCFTSLATLKLSKPSV